MQDDVNSKIASTYNCYFIFSDDDFDNDDDDDQTEIVDDDDVND